MKAIQKAFGVAIMSVVLAILIRSTHFEIPPLLFQAGLLTALISSVVLMGYVTTKSLAVLLHSKYNRFYKHRK
ncbi:MAG: hypothetical protein ACE5I1_23800 [bacterium]